MNGSGVSANRSAVGEKLVAVLWAMLEPAGWPLLGECEAHFAQT